MPARTKGNIAALMGDLHALDDSDKQKALEFGERASPPVLFDVMHAMRRWYSGQTMARKLVEHRELLRGVMDIEPKDAVGVFRGFKVPNDNPLAKAQAGDKLTLGVTRNHEISSWTTDQNLANRFSGGGKGKTGLIVKLVDHEGIEPILAPPSRTKPWFNKAYEQAIGTSFRDKKHEYLIKAPEVEVEVMRVKKAFENGHRAALTRFKLSNAMGANPGVAPQGDEQSHGTERHQYPTRSPASIPDGQDPDMPDWLWNISDIDHLAPGRADGTYGQEVIG